MVPRHRHERGEKCLIRRQGSKRPYDRMLIVCEGSKSEVNYFNAIRQEKRIPSADIRVVPSDYGTTPLQIVQFAIKELKRLKSFDHVYVVFDRDDHLTYHDALNKTEATNKKLRNDAHTTVPFTAIPSVPSFELWVLLHFRDVQAPMHRDQVLAELMKPAAYPAYAKNSLTVFQDTKPHLAQAEDRAKRLRERFDKRNGSDPCTDADILTQALLSIADRFS